MHPGPARSFPPTAVAILALAAWLAIAACSKAPSREPLPRDSVVLALGDSLTYGTGASRETSYPAVLASITGWRVVNAGVPGETAEEGCARLPDLLDEHRPRAVLILLGGNDFLRRLPDAGVTAALRRCVQDARKAGVEPVLLAVPRLGGNGLADAGLYADVAKSERAELVDSGLADVLAKRSLRADFVHPNADGYRAVAERIADGLRRSGHLRR